MELGVIWSKLSLLLVAAVCCAKALPMDMETIQDDMKLAAMNGMGVALDILQNAQAQGNFNEEVSFGPLNLKNSFGAGVGGEGAAEENRRRRRRSAIENEAVQSQPTPDEHRHKRSPCSGRKRGQATTEAPAAGGNENPEPELPRRRKRSPNENDVDENINIIPGNMTFGEKSQQFSEAIRQAMQKMLDAMAGVFDNLKDSVQRASQGQPEKPYEM